jgi:hypothetical protein
MRQRPAAGGTGLTNESRRPWIDVEEFIVQSVIGNMIADSLQLGLNNATRLLAGVNASRFARWAAPGGEIVQSNHGAFVFGHLSIYSPIIVNQLSGDATAISPSERFRLVFSKDAQCEDDPSGTIYPPQDEIVERFFSGYQKALTTLRGADDELMRQPNLAGGRSTELFPTIGSVLAFYAGGHVMMHLGQMSAWRRMLGLGAA